MVDQQSGCVYRVQRNAVGVGLDEPFQLDLAAIPGAQVTQRATE